MKLKNGFGRLEENFLSLKPQATFSADPIYFRWLVHDILWRLRQGHVIMRSEN